MSKRLVLKATLLVIAALGLVMMLAAFSLAQSRAFSVTPLIQRGDPRPDGGTFFTCDNCVAWLPDFHAFNDRGEALVETMSNQSFEALFLVSDSSKTLLFDAAHPTAYGKLLLSYVTLNNQGQAAFIGFNKEADQTSLFLYSDGHLSQVIDDKATPLIGGTFLRAGFWGGRINDQGDLIFQGMYQD